MSRAYDFTKRRAASSGGRQRKKTVDAARKIRPRRASRLHVRKLSCQGSYEYGIERHPAPRNRYLQEVSRARSCSRGFALLGVSHLPRLVEAQGSHAKIHPPRSTHRPISLGTTLNPNRVKQKRPPCSPAPSWLAHSVRLQCQFQRGALQCFADPKWSELQTPPPYSLPGSAPASFPGSAQCPRPEQAPRQAPVAPV